MVKINLTPKNWKVIKVLNHSKPSAFPYYIRVERSGSNVMKLQTQCILLLSENLTKLYSKTCLKRTLENRQNKDLNDKW